jgi:hypothetical protein
MIRHHRIGATIAVTLAFTASLASTAWADPAPLAQGESAIAATQTGATSPVRPNPDEQTVTRPAAMPARADSPAPCGDACSGGGYGVVRAKPISVPVTSSDYGFGEHPQSVVASGGGHAHPTTASSEPPVANGFHWGDAGIGAGGALGLMMLLVGGALVMTRARQRPRRNQARPTG